MAHRIATSATAVALIAASALLFGACGGSSDDPPLDTPGATRTPAPAPSSTPTPAASPTPALATFCESGLTGLVVAGSGENFLVGLSRNIAQYESRAEALRFNAAGERQDEDPLIVSQTGGPGTPSFRVDGATATNDAFQVGIAGGIGLDSGAWRSLVQHRAVPFAGAITADAIDDASNVPIGTCRTDLNEKDGIVPTLDGSDIHRVEGWAAGCDGEILLEWFNGLPGAPMGPGPQQPDTTMGSPALARGSAQVAGVYFLATTPPQLPDVNRHLAAGWLESASEVEEPADGERLVLTPIEYVTSVSPALAALGETFLAAWASAPASGGSTATEIRRMRFDADSGALDPAGGLVEAGGGGAIHGPVAASNGTHFRLLWGEQDGSSLALWTRQFAESGSPVEANPVRVVEILPDDPFALAATADATLAAWLTASTENPDETCLHVLPISD